MGFCLDNGFNLPMDWGLSLLLVLKLLLFIWRCAFPPLFSHGILRAWWVALPWLGWCVLGLHQGSVGGRGNGGQWCDLPGGWQEFRALCHGQALASSQQELANPIGSDESSFLGSLYTSCLGEQKGKAPSVLVKCCHGPEHQGQTPSLPELAATSGKRRFGSTTLSVSPEANLPLGGESTNGEGGVLFQSPGCRWAWGRLHLRSPPDPAGRGERLEKGSLSRV